MILDIKTFFPLEDAREIARVKNDDDDHWTYVVVEDGAFSFVQIYDENGVYLGNL